jgi:serine/threonine protein kinase
MDSTPEREYDYSPSIIDPNKQYDSLQTIENGAKISIPFNGINYDLIVGKKLGAGGFGTVYRCTDSSKKEYALKKIPSRSDRGIPCLFEASMMCSYSHPSLNKCIAVSASLDGIFLLMDVAKFDLHGLVKFNQLNNIKMTMVDYRNILFRVAQGMSYLHQKGIVHGDIKCNNVLYYSEDDIRITDFNLSTLKKWQSNIHLCTAIYRPLEIWMQKEWTDRIDIWCYGCLMYELLYESMLFQCQGDSTNKKELRKKYLNALIEWAHFNSPGKIKMDKYDVSYISIKLEKELMVRKSNLLSNIKSQNTETEYNPEREAYINLMLRCLQILDKNRPHIDTVISDQFFTIIRNNPVIKALYTSPRPTGPINNKDLYVIIESDIKNYAGSENKELIRIATHICVNYVQKCGYDNHIIKKVCVWMAKKLIRIDSESQQIPIIDKNLTKDQFLKSEIDICNKLNFKLHSI